MTDPFKRRINSLFNFVGEFTMAHRERELERIGDELRSIKELLKKFLGIQSATAIAVVQITKDGVQTMNPITPGVPYFIQLLPLPSGSQFDSPADLALTSTDSDVSIVPAPGDTTGTVFKVTQAAPSGDSSVVLDATGLAGGVAIGGTVTLSEAAPANPSPATSIGFQQVTDPSQPGGGVPVSNGTTSAPTASASAAKATVGNTKAPSRR
jgi:hypothetical protein